MGGGGEQALADADHLAVTSHLPWAVTALGPVPGEPAARLAWQQKAAAIGGQSEPGS